MASTDLKSEWTLLQNQFDSYEKHSLIIKLVGILVFSGAYFSNKLGLITLVILLVIWFQDAIWKTFQSRIETRLLSLEQFIKNDADDAVPFQFNSEFLSSRSLKGLIAEYIGQARRPTVAFPHAPLVGFCMVLIIFC